jgi:putative membrane protein
MNRISAVIAAAALTVSGMAIAQGASINDAQIAHIAYTAGQLDIEAARQALQRSHDAGVRAFAQTMVRDHQAVNEKALALVKKLHVTPEANPTSASLSEAAAKTRHELAGLSGAAFDRAYVRNEVAYHRTVNSALRSTLIPNAHNGELKSLLETGLALFREHQAHAETLASHLR